MTTPTKQALLDEARSTHQTLADEVPTDDYGGSFGLDGFVGDALFACALSEIDPRIDPEPALLRAVDAFEAPAGGLSRARKAQAEDCALCLHHGLAGLGFVLATYAPADDRLAAIDRTLQGGLRILPSACSLQTGVAGVALYASLRSHVESGRELQRHALDALAKAVVREDGALWHTPRAYAELRRVRVPSVPVTEFGMVHGVGGALVALAALAAEGLEDAAALAREVLAAAWKWDRGGGNHFGWIHFGAQEDGETLELPGGAFCVGDPGVFRSLWLTASTVGDTSSATRALEQLRIAAAAASDAQGQLPGRPGRIDLCCGVSSIAQIYHRMYAETNEAVFRAARDRLLLVCAEKLETVGNPGFVYGRAGGILALLAAHCDRDPAWDSILGLRLPRRLGHQK